MANKERVKWLEVVRMMAIFCVIMCHVVEGYTYTFNVEFMSTVSVPSKCFAFCFFTIGRIGVPLFLMISGWLLLDREYDKETTLAFWKNKCLNLLVVTWFWVVAYKVFFLLYEGQSITLVSLIKSLLMVGDLGMNHLWYMPVILGLYLTIPFIANGLKCMERSMILIPYTILVVLYFGVPSLNLFLNIFGYNLGTTLIDAGFSGGVYGLYLISGYLIKKGTLKNVSSRKLGIAVIVCFIVVVLMQMLSYQNGVNYNLYYDNIFILLIGIGMFEILSRQKMIPFYNCVRVLSYYSFAIYLVHNPISIVMRKCLMNIVPSRPLLVILVWGITIVLSLVVSYGISKIPKVGRKILYMK